MSIEYLDLSDYLAIAVEVTGLSAATVVRVTKLDLADSAARASGWVRGHRVLPGLRRQGGGARP